MGNPQGQNAPTICICTVGTGTAGRDSFVAHGILAGIRAAAPDKVWLCPSASPGSLEVAGLVAGELRNRGSAPEIHTLTLADHDDLDRSRRELRALLADLRKTHPNAAIVLNPTSGTKQMTTAAVLAGVDAGVDRIEFVVGERRDGVVRTGAERITRADVRRIRARQCAGNALALIRGGAYGAAERILQPYADFFPRFLTLTRVFGFWNRFAYRRALEITPPGPELAAVRKALDALASAPAISLEHAADMTAFAERALDSGEPEEALAVLYRSAELLAKLRLQELGIDIENPTLNGIDRILHLPKRVFDRTAAILRGDSPPFLGLAMLYELLETTDDPLAARIRGDARTWSLLQERHKTRYGHGAAFVDPTPVRELHGRLQRAAARQWPDFPQRVRAFRFPDIQPLIQEELDHV